MNMDMALSIAKRFVTQPLGKRKIYLEKMLAENISPVNLPIPAIKELFDAIPLSYAQQRQWFLWQLEPDGAAYNMSVALQLKGKLDSEALRASFEALIARHETLRTTFHQDGEQAIQIIHPATSFPLAVETLSTQPGDDLDETLKTLVEGEAQGPFDLEHGPLLRVKLLRLAEDHHVLILTMHHIVSDGWSMPIMVDELMQLYEGYRIGQPVTLPELLIQYADYAIWQRNWMEAGEQERQLAYWKAKLGDQQPVLELPTDHPRPTVQSHAGASLSIEITPELSRSLKQLAQQQGVTLFMLLLASFQTLLHRYSGQDDIRVGVPIANRNRVETERLIGFFVNTQVLKAEFELETTFNELLQQIKRTTLEAQAYQDLPFEQLVEALQPERSLSHSPLFQVMFNHQMETHGNAQQLPGLQVEGLSREKQTAQFDLTLDTCEHSGGISASLTYATALFEADTITRLADHWLSLLHAITEQPDQRISELPLLSEKEQQQIIYDWNCTEAIYPSDQCIHQLIEAQAEKTPDAVAIVFGSQALTYQQLNQKANQLAYKLRDLGVGPDILVGIAVDRSMEMMLGLLAILKAGGAYVPLDPEYPQERLAYMLEHSNAGLLLTQHHLLDQLPIADINIWCLDRDWHELEGYSNANLHTLVDPEHLAYCIYTSGSTGKPKGVAVRHQALTNFLAGMALQPGIQAQDKVLALTSLSFDIAGLELYLPLLAGASVIMLANQQNKDPQALLELIQDQSVSIIQATPSTWRMLLDAIPVGGLAGCKLLCGGEALASDLASRMIEQTGHVWNLYGPTETTIWSGLHYLDAENPAPYLGKPIANTALQILDRAFGVAPPGVAGELLIGGHGLARGYLHRPDLTAERFVPDPLDRCEQGGGRLYRTGDLARYRADGIMEYISRIDHQVKIRGFRIELGEIEARLQEHAAIREAAVIDVEGPGSRQLAAYLVPADLTLAQSNDHQQATVLRDELRAHLRIALPDYMVPSHLVFLEKMPLTPNGKLDRKALPAPAASQLQQEYVAPQSELEQQIAAIWADVLKVEKVGLNDNFFELGGHSLLATQVISRIRQALDIELPLRTLFETPVLGEFAAHTGQGTSSTVPAFTRVNRDQSLPLSYAQQRQWFLWQLEPEGAAYNMSAAMRLKGRLDIEALRLSFESLIARHETLRTTFRQDGEQALQAIHSQINLVLDQETLETADETLIRSRVEAEVAKPFDLEHGPLLRVRLMRLAEDEHVLVLTMHHIVSDGWSMPIMVDELIQLYEGYRNGQTISLPELPIQYADYAIWQRQWMEAGEQERQLAYWKEQLGDEQPVLELPTDRPRPAIQNQQGAGLSIELNDQLAQSLKQLAQQQGVTLFMLLLASFQTLLHRYSGQNDIRVGVPIANRNRVETEQLIGFFVNTQVLKAEFDLHTTFSELLKQVQQTALGAQAHQDLPFEQLVEALQPERSLSHSPLFQVMYNHQSQVRGASRQLPGLQVAGLVREETTTKFDLSLDTVEHEQGIDASLSYATALFDQSTIERLAGHWINLLHGIVKSPQKRIDELPLLSEEAQQQIIYDWNRTETSHPSDQRIHQLIEIQAERTPTATAVVFGNEELTYQALNQRSNQLAYKLRELGVGPDVLVGVAMERSLGMVTSLLAILKAGGAYVPLDPEYPQGRLAHMMEDSGIKLLLTQSHLLNLLPVPDNIQVLSLDAVKEWLNDYNKANPSNFTQPDNLAYVIYTSGSTGLPKGVAVRQRSLLNHMCWMQERFEVQASDRVLQKTAFSFDAAVWEFWLPLLSGAQLHMASPSLMADLSGVWNEVERLKITILQLAPSVLQALLPYASSQCMASLRLLCCGGEALSERLVREVSSSWEGPLINLYGPTEATIDTCSHVCKAGDIPAIGRPISNVRAHIVHGSMNVCPAGCSGELLIAGESLARGYLNRPTLVAERFIPDPFDSSEQGGGQLYRTGDLARYRADGVIEYIGRIDYQVKIRGFRIELGEIESRLKGYNSIREAVVLAINGENGKQLVAYLITDVGLDQQAEFSSAIREYLKDSLPGYMVPTHLVFLEAMPLTSNGKLDRKALPVPNSSASTRAQKMPRTRIERKLSDIWQKVLNVGSTGLQDDFFELGGHSLLVLAAVQKIRDQIDSNFSVYDFMMHPTIEQQAMKLRSELAGFKSSLIKLNSTVKESPTIYCLPPGGGTVFPYYPLAHALNGRYSVCALLNRAFVDQGNHYRTWDEMVVFYLKEIRESQPEGPYRLLGWSTGGAIAWDISQRLEAAGETVEWLGLIDPTLPAELAHFYTPAHGSAEAEPIHDPASLDSRNKEAVLFIQAFFPEKDETYLAEKVAEGRGRGLQDDTLVDFLLKDLAKGKGLDHYLFREIYNIYSQAAELAIGYESFKNVGELCKDIKYKPLIVNPSCWWSSLTLQAPRVLELYLLTSGLLNGISSSHVLELPHQKMVMSYEFIESLKAELVRGE
ncbi:non-ribosomal peptide synthetase [Pseudomonas sp. FME51]|uniref:non-ribosomal peptide synthetase n=1 Tax=Pseudomonas sp. FME51 TaxID=2742609 RepID=UPI001866B845|nr:non-ribosomal peptide synthetase [Pseudomonas sp. FME51]